jgi:hypothetical protein
VAVPFGIVLCWLGYSLVYYGYDRIRGGNDGLVSLMYPGRYKPTTPDAQAGKPPTPTTPTAQAQAAAAPATTPVPQGSNPHGPGYSGATGGAIHP